MHHPICNWYRLALWGNLCGWTLGAPQVVHTYGPPSQYSPTVLAATATATAVPAQTSTSKSSVSSSSSTASALTFPIGANGPRSPVVFPLSNGFPNLSGDPEALTALSIQAHGSLPNGPSPPVSIEDLTSFQVIQLAETFEVYYFTQLLLNITNHVDGFEPATPALRQQMVNTFTAIQGQEQWHALTAQLALAQLKQDPIAPCVFRSPVTNLAGAIKTASSFTALVFGALEDTIIRLGRSGNFGAMALLVAGVGEEGEQNGAFRTFLGGVAAADSPYLLQAPPAFYYSMLHQTFIVPGSCPNANLINLPIFEPLNLLTHNIQAKDQMLDFSIGTSSTHGLSIVYLNQQNLPIVQAINGSHFADGMSTFSVSLPFTMHGLFGLTVVAVTNSSGPFSNASEVADYTLFGPALIYPD
jgi:hypothetical protein